MGSPRPRRAVTGLADSAGYAHPARSRWRRGRFSPGKEEVPGPPLPVRAVWYGGSETRLGELWTMLHLPYTGMVLAFVLAGSFVAPAVSLTVTVALLAAYFLGLGIGAHFLDQLSGMGSRYVAHWRDRELWLGGLLGVGGGVSIGLLGLYLRPFGPWMLPLVAGQAFFAVAYPLAPVFGRVFHSNVVFALSWGAGPVLVSSYAQAGSVYPWALVVAACAATAAWVEIRLSREARAQRRIARRSRGASGVDASDPSLPLWKRPEVSLRVLVVATYVAAVGLVLARVAFGGGVGP
jgi:hypothetical protein